MGKNTAQEIIDLGFTPEMFRKTDGTFPAYVDGVIAKQTAVLEGRIGTAQYNSATTVVQNNVKLAEEYLVAAELVDRRINILIGNATGNSEGTDTRSEERKRDRYKKEADRLIEKIAAGVTTDGDNVGFGVLESSHF